MLKSCYFDSKIELSSSDSLRKFAQHVAFLLNFISGISWLKMHCRMDGSEEFSTDVLTFK